MLLLLLQVPLTLLDKFLHRRSALRSWDGSSRWWERWLGQWLDLRCSLNILTLLAQQLLLLQGQLVLVVAIEVAPEEEGEFGVLLLLLHRHLLELGPVPRHELRQLVDDIPQLLV